MCITKIRKSKRTIVTGYKWVIKRNNKYYSPATGLEYKIGAVPMLEDMLSQKVIGYEKYCNYAEGNMFHSPNYDGHTAIFKTYKCAYKHINYSTKYNNILLVKMTISKNIKTAQHTPYALQWVDIGDNKYLPVYIGKYINKIEEL